jgi:hypothetical protein
MDRRERDDGDGEILFRPADEPRKRSIGPRSPDCGLSGYSQDVLGLDPDNTCLCSALCAETLCGSSWELYLLATSPYCL